MMLREGKENRLIELTDNNLKRDIVQKKKKKKGIQYTLSSY